MIKSEFDGTYWWVVIPDELWATREYMGYYDGYPIYSTWSRG